MAGAAARRVVIVGGGASGTLTAVHLLRRASAGLVITVLEPRERLGVGVAFGTPDLWHRLNVPAITMTGLPGEPDHFRAYADVEPHEFPGRAVFGRYLGDLLASAEAGSSGSLSHVRVQATGVREDRRPGSGAPLLVDVAGGDALAAHAVVLATGNPLPRPPAFLDALVGSRDPRLVVDPWAEGSLDAIEAGETVAIVGTGHTALDLASSLLRSRRAGLVIAISRHGAMPRPHEQPWRPSPPEPVFDVATFATWSDKPAEVRRALEAYPLGWRQALDSLRPTLRELWLAMTEGERRTFLDEHRREWEIHRSRLAPGVADDVAAWVAEGRVEIRAASIAAVEAGSGGLRVVTGDGGSLVVGHLLVATGPDESASASPVLAATVAAGLARPGSQDLGIDVDPYLFRVRDAAGRDDRALFALGPIIRGSVWESIAIPEIRQEALVIAEQILAG